MVGNSRIFPVCCLAFLTLTGTGCGPGDSDARRSTMEPGPLFLDVTAELGVAFEHVNGMSGERHYPEIVGSGGALFDYDNDGDLDLYVVQSGRLGLTDTPRPLDYNDRLFRNDLTETGIIRFVDVTGEAGIRAVAYGMGVAAGDYDNDGWPDLYLTNFGPNQLWRNNGDGTFSDVTEQTGTGDRRWSSSAAYLDFDRDGSLDLYVTNYVDYRLGNAKTCRTPSGRPDYCGPASYDGETDRLLRNRGDGSFEDVSARAGILGLQEPGLGVVAADFDGDGWPDLYVANDGRPNSLWSNRGDGTFRNVAMLSGAALNMGGQAEASMGVQAGDFDNDGDIDLFMTHLRGETNTYYRNDGEGLFFDASDGSGLGGPSLGLTGFGTAALDFDNDGRLDIAVANGSVHLLDDLVREGVHYPYGMRNQLFRNLGGGRFADFSVRAGPAFDVREIGRGLTYGDLDNDGDTDLVLFNNSGPLRILLNDSPPVNAWLGLRLFDPRHRRDDLGARVVARTDGGAALSRRVHTDGSYLSAADSRVLLGLGHHPGPVAVHVRWSDGLEEHWPELTPNQYLTLVRGGGGRPPGK